MRKHLMNKGFTLVELVIVMAIMAVLIGVLAPTYLKHVERTKKTTDCSNIGSVLDACEVLAADPDVNWVAGDLGKITIVIDTNETGHATSYSPSTSEVVTALEDMVSTNSTSLSASWGPFTIYAECDENGHVSFDIGNDSQITELSTYSEVLAKRLE